MKKVGSMVLVLLCVVATVFAAGTSETTANSPVSSQTKKEKFYVYGFNDDVAHVLDLVYERYPALKDKIVYVNSGDSSAFQDKIDALLKTPNAPDSPDMFALEGGFIKKYVESDSTMDIKEVGITDAQLADMYPYTLDLARDARTGAVKALTWQVCAGAFIYNAKLAKSLLGVNTPEEMQACVKDWDAFTDTARKVKENSNGKVKLISSNDDVYYIFVANKKKPWVDQTGTFQMDDMMSQYLDLVRILQKENLTAGTTSWSNEWYAGMGDGSVLAYIGPTWFISSVLDEHAGESSGDWRLCQGPAPYYWGGTWLATASTCSDREIAEKVMEVTACDKDSLEEYAEKNGEFVNNRSALKEALAKGYGKSKLLGDQDYIKFFLPLAEKINTSFVSGYDTKACELLRTQVNAYASGTKTKEKAMDDFEDAFAEAFPGVKFGK